MSIYKKDNNKGIIAYKRIALGIMCLCVLYAILIRYTAMVYYTNDDTAIQSTLSLAEEGNYWWVHQYIGAWMSLFIGELYILFKGVQWWYAFHHILIAVGVFGVDYVALNCLNERYNAIVSSALVILGNVTAYSLFVSRVAFTTTPAIFISGIIALILHKAKDKKNGYKYWLIELLTVLLCYVVALMMRVESGLILVPFILLAILFYIVEKYEISVQSIMTYIVIVTVFLSVSAILINTSNRFIYRVNGDEFKRFNTARIKYTDHGVDSYYDNPNIYESVGWDETIANIGPWIFICNEKDEISLDYITTNSKNNSENLSYVETIKNAIRMMKNDKFMIIYGGLYSLAAVIGLYTVVCNNKMSGVVFWLMNNVGSLIIIMYVVLYLGRWLLRVEYVIVLPATIIDLFLIYYFGDKDNDLSFYEANKDKLEGSSYPFVAKMMIGGIILIAFFEMHKLAMDKDRLDSLSKAQVLTQDYVNNHPDNVYINRVIDINPISWKEPDSKNVYNIFCDGGSMWKGSAWQHFCDIHNYENGLTPEIFRKENVYYRANNIDAYFLRYMMERHNAVGVAVVDHLTEVNELCPDVDLYIYHFVYEDNQDIYPHYLTIDEENGCIVENDVN